MDRRQMSIAVIGVAVAVLAVTCVSASISETNTPLYTLRMEQLSSRMNFLPVEKNGFTYTTEKGCQIDCGALGYCSTTSAETDEACVEVITTRTCFSCVITCWYSCWSTCNQETCENTCPDTCNPTCDEQTCGFTCPDTCNPTCNTETCSGETCYGTCDHTYCTCQPPPCPMGG